MTATGTPVTVPYGNANTYQQWAEDLITYADQLGGKLPNTGGEVSLISAWEQSENPVSQIGKGYNNPLNATLKSAGGVQLANGTEPGSSFVPTYTNAIAGLEATWDELNQGPSDAPGNYAPELSALENQSGSGLVSALGTPGSVWGSSPSTVSKILSEGASTASNNQGGATPLTGTATSPGTVNATDVLNLNPGDGFGIPGAIAGGVESAGESLLSPIFNFIENAGFVFLGVILVVVALVILARAGMNSASEHNNEQRAKAEPDVEVEDSRGKSKGGGISVGGGSGGAEEAEAAAAG
jgi:hypothetical protein